MTAQGAENGTLTVGQVAARFGITVRTLHHYDRIGLVVPSERSFSGYRLYAATDIERLARVVMLRRLEMPLDGIAEALDGDVTGHLVEQRAAVMARIEELSGLLRAIDTALEMETAQEAGMTENRINADEIKEIFGAEWDEAYEAEAERRWGRPRRGLNRAAASRSTRKPTGNGSSPRATRLWRPWPELCGQARGLPRVRPSRRCQLTGLTSKSGSTPCR